jgi:translation initiation factor IF-1
MMKNSWLLSAGVAALCVVLAVPAYGQNAVTVRGRVVRMQAPDQFVVKTTDNKEVIFVANPQTKYVINEKAVKYTDLRVGADVSAVYTVQDNRNLVSAVTVGVAAAQPAEGTPLQGTVVRVVGKDQVIVRTQDNKEVTVYIVPETKYTFNDRPGAFTDLAPGADIRIMYDVRDRRHVARNILGLPRRNK